MFIYEQYTRELHNFIVNRWGKYVLDKTGDLIGKVDGGSVIAYGDWTCAPLKENKRVCITCTKLRHRINKSYNRWKNDEHTFSPLRNYGLSDVSKACDMIYCKVVACMYRQLAVCVQCGLWLACIE